MNKEELHQIIQQLEATNSKDEAYFAIEQYGGGTDESFIKANKAGLELMAAELLLASTEFDEALKTNHPRSLSWNYNHEWLGGEVVLEYIEPVEKREERIIRPPYNPSRFKAALDSIFALSILLVILVAFITGIVTVIGWFV